MLPETLSTDIKSGEVGRPLPPENTEVRIVEVTTMEVVAEQWLGRTLVRADVVSMAKRYKHLRGAEGAEANGANECGRNGRSSEESGNVRSGMCTGTPTEGVFAVTTEGGCQVMGQDEEKTNERGQDDPRVRMNPVASRMAAGGVQGLGGVNVRDRGKIGRKLG